MRSAARRGGRRDCAFEDSVREARCAAVLVGVVHSVDDQAPDELHGCIDRRQPMLGGQVNDELLVRLCDSVKPHDERVGTLPDCGIERRPQILGRSHVEKLRLETQGSSRPLDVIPLSRNRRVTHVEENRESDGSRKQFPEQFDPFRE